MDFYTLNTSVDLADPDNLATVTRAIGYFTQPMLMGAPQKDAEGGFLRFGVRGDTLSLVEETFMDMLCFDTVFTTENTTLVRSEHV